MKDAALYEIMGGGVGVACGRTRREARVRERDGRGEREREKRRGISMERAFDLKGRIGKL